MGDRFWHKKDQPNDDVSFRPTKYKICQGNRISFDEYGKAE